MDNLEEKINSLFSSPESLAQIKRLAEALSGGGAGAAAGESVPEPGRRPGTESNPALDPKLMQVFASVMKEYSAPSEAASLINALKPYLKAEKTAKIDKAIAIARLARAAKAVLPEIGGRSLV